MAHPARPMLLLALLASAAAAPAHAAVISVNAGTYDWSTANVGLLSGNTGWSTSTDTSDQVTNTAQPTGFSGNYLSMGTTAPNTDTYTRNNGGTFSYTIPSDALTLTMSLVLTASTSQPGGISWMGLNDADGGAFRFGLRDTSNWGFREKDSNIQSLGNGTGDGMFTATTQSFLVTVVIDLVNDTLDFYADNLATGAGAETIATGVAIDDFDPADFDGLFLRSRGRLDVLTISYTIQVPTPAALPAGLAMLGLAAMRRRSAPRPMARSAK